MKMNCKTGTLMPTTTPTRPTTTMPHSLRRAIPHICAALAHGVTRVIAAIGPACRTLLRPAGARMNETHTSTGSARPRKGGSLHPVATPRRPVGAKSRRGRQAALGVAFTSSCVVCAASAHAQTIADSVADFSGVQGQRGWEYGYYAGPFNPTGFQHLPLFDTTTIGAPAWHRPWIPGGWVTLLFAQGGHPNGTVACCGGVVREVNWAVRRWISTHNGPVTIEWLLRDRDPNCGDGVGASVFLDGALRWSGAIANGDVVGVRSSINLCLQVGMTLDFAIDPVSGNQLCDSTDLQIVVRGPIVVQPTSTLTCPSGTATFSVTAAGTGPFTYQWQVRGGGVACPWVDLVDGPNPAPCGGFGFIAVDGAQTPTIDVTDEGPAFGDGPDLFRCIVSNACGSVTSNPATLTVANICDMNNDGGSDTADVIDLADAVASGVPVPNPSACADFNQDGAADTADVIDLADAIAGGTCP